MPVQRFGAIVVTTFLPKNELIRINKITRNRTVNNGEKDVSAPVCYIFINVTVY